MSKYLEKQLEKNLALSLLDFRNEKEMIEFLKDFLTEKELETLTKRINILYWLNKKRTPKNIKTNLKVPVSSIKSTIPLLQKESIKKALQKIDADAWSETWSKKIKGLIKSP